MIDFLLQVFWETWSIFKEASVFLLFGFALAGVIAVLIPARTLLRFLGRGKVKSVLWASALGIPLPLCSCGVVPTALGLRRHLIGPPGVGPLPGPSTRRLARSQLSGEFVGRPGPSFRLLLETSHDESFEICGDLPIDPL